MIIINSNNQYQKILLKKFLKLKRHQNQKLIQLTIRKENLKEKNGLCIKLTFIMNF